MRVTAPVQISRLHRGKIRCCSVKPHEIQRVGNADSQHKIFWSRGLGAVFNPEFRGVKSFVKHGIEVLGCRPKVLTLKSVPFLLLSAYEFVHRKTLLQKRAAFFQYGVGLIAEQEQRLQHRVRASLLNDSFSIWYLTQLAKRNHEIFSRIRHISLVEPAFGSSELLGPWGRFLHGLGPGKIMRESRSLLPHLNDALVRHDISLLMVVPRADRVVSAHAAEEAYAGIAPEVKKQLIVIENQDHGVLSPSTPDKVRAQVITHLTSHAKGVANVPG